MKRIYIALIALLTRFGLGTFLAVQTLQIVAMSFTRLDSMPGALLAVGGWSAEIGVSSMGILAVIALVDIIGLGRWSRYLRKRRVKIWLLMVLGYTSQAAVALLNGYVPQLALVYLWSAAGCFAVAFVDIQTWVQENCEVLNTTPAELGIK